MNLAHRLARLLANGATLAPLVEDEGDWSTPGMAQPKVAAVLVAFVDRPHPTLLLTRRQPHLRSHADQVAFPGGQADDNDADSIATALREAHEEVGLAPEWVDVIGLAMPFRTGSGYIITPVLAVIPPDLPLVADPVEVARMFEVRCDHLFNPDKLVRQSIDWQGGVRHYWEGMAEGERIWGVTASMIRNIAAMLGLDREPHALNRDDTR